MTRLGETTGLAQKKATETKLNVLIFNVVLVRQYLAKDEQSVEGLIIAHKMEEMARYAILALPNVRMMTYEVEFWLDEFQL